MERKKDFVDWHYGLEALGTFLVEDRDSLCRHLDSDIRNTVACPL